MRELLLYAEIIHMIFLRLIVNDRQKSISAKLDMAHFFTQQIINNACFRNLIGSSDTNTMYLLRKQFISQLRLMPPSISLNCSTSTTSGYFSNILILSFIMTSPFIKKRRVKPNADGKCLIDLFHFMTGKSANLFSQAYAVNGAYLL